MVKTITEWEQEEKAIGNGSKSIDTLRTGNNMVKRLVRYATDKW